MSEDCGCFLFLLLLPVALVILYVVWRWAFGVMGLA